MDHQIKLYRIFIASPGDLADERTALRDVVEQINECSKETNWRIELLSFTFRAILFTLEFTPHLSVTRAS
jgi:hypothetical protein